MDDKSARGLRMRVARGLRMRVIRGYPARSEGRDIVECACYCACTPEVSWSPVCAMRAGARGYSFANDNGGE